MLRFLLSLAAALLALAGTAGPAQAARSLDVGFLDPVYFAPERSAWFQRTVDVGSDIVRIQIGWSVLNTRKRPPGLDARDPADPLYDFRLADAAVRDADARGLDVLVSFTGAPRWAEGAGRPASAAPGSWRPDPAALGDFGTALARRYSGSFPDPARPGRTLPRVKAFQVWNEPNLPEYLSPQWRNRRSAAPAHYRRMLNAFYHAVKSVRRDALVVMAGTSPFGDPQPGGRRIMPARFVRELLCLRRGRGRSLRRLRCSAPARFDVLSHHPYQLGRPRRKALNADDVSIPDLGKLKRLLRAAERSGRALPRKRHRLWVTEFAYDSSPDPDGIPVARQARFLQESFYLLWRQGVDTILWLRIRDQLEGRSFAETNQSGVFYYGGRPKPSATAFRFPLVAERAGSRSIRVWGRSPLAGTVVIERRSGSRWRVVRSLRAGRHGVFTARVRGDAGATSLRARVGDERSLSWRLR